jgi:hypothetical protein
VTDAPRDDIEQTPRVYAGQVLRFCGSTATDQRLVDERLPASTH